MRGRWGMCGSGGMHGIRSMSRRYALYWNAFLFKIDKNIDLSHDPIEAVVDPASG